MKAYVIQVVNQDDEKYYVYRLEIMRDKVVVTYTKNIEKAIIVSRGSDEYQYLTERFKETCQFIEV